MMFQICSDTLHICMSEVLSRCSLVYRLVLRLRADDPNAILGLGSKFGCSVAEGCSLLQTAKNLGIDIAGVRSVLCLLKPDASLDHAPA